MEKKTPIILIIVGITGDLASRKLLPAISEILKAGALPEDFQILGVTRQSNVDVDKLLKNIEDKDSIKKYLTIFQMDLDDQAEYTRLQDKLKEIENKFKNKAEYLFYLSVPPQASESIIQSLGVSGLSKKEQTKLLLEKPFGVDLASATTLIKEIDKYFNKDQVYRIDHYLAKEMTQNIVVFREGNSLFKHTWNKDFIECIEILASEDIGIEGRSSFYEQTGALRDVLQSHLLQLTAIILMDIGNLENTRDIPSRRLKALKSLSIPSDKPLRDYVSRGQYRNYKEEVDNPKSNVETYVSITLESDDSRWTGVPITLTAGKMLDKKTTEIRIFYKKDNNRDSNELILRLQPNEGIALYLWSKRPGYEKEFEKHMLHFNYGEYYNKLPEAYEQVLLDASRSDHNLFTSSEEVIESWRIVEGVQEAWSKSSDDLFIYVGGVSPSDIEKNK